MKILNESTGEKKHIELANEHITIEDLLRDPSVDFYFREENLVLNDISFKGGYILSARKTHSSQETFKTARNY